MATFTWTPDAGLARSTTAKVDEVKFGDGYSQRINTNLNPLDEELSPSFSNRTRVEIDLIDAFLIAHKGMYSFDYAVPGSPTKKYICKTWTPVYGHDWDCSLNAKFERVYEA